MGILFLKEIKVVCNNVLNVSYTHTSARLCVCVCVLVCLFYVSIPHGSQRGGSSLPKPLKATLWVGAFLFLPCTCKYTVGLQVKCLTIENLCTATDVWLRCLSFRHISRLGRRSYFPSLFVSISLHLVFIARAMCVIECNCSSFMYQFSSSVTRAVSADVAVREVLFLIVPKCTHNPEVWTKYVSL